MAFYRFPREFTTDLVPDFHTHPEYDDAIDEWEKIRDVIQGAKYVKARGRRYLPCLFQQETEDYNRYKERACFFGATRRTREAAVGLLLRKSPTLETEPEIEKLLADVDMCGATLADYMRTAAEELSSLGRSGTFIDWSTAETRPYFSFYHAEDILDWETERIEGRMKLTRLVLRECTWERAAGTGEKYAVQNLRFYALVDGAVTAEIVKITGTTGSGLSATKTAQGTGNVKGPETAGPERKPLELSRKGKALTAIPFVFHGPDGDRPEVPIAPLSDLADINISHYQTSADLENGRHVAGIPTPYAFGFEPDTALILGTSHAWVTAETDAKAGFIEFTGQGLASLEKAMADKQQQMAALGARMLEIQGADAEAFETVQLRSNSEQASLVNISEALSATVSKCLQWAAWWFTLDEALEDVAKKNLVVLNTDFVAARVDGPTLTALISAYQMGAISWPTFFYQLQQGEIYPDNWKMEQEEEAILQKPASAPAPPEPATGPGDKKPDPKEKKEEKKPAEA